MFISSKSRVSGLQRLPRFKYYNVLKWESRLNLEVDTAKNTDYIEKHFKQKLFRIKFLAKTQWAHMSISFRSGAKGLLRLTFLKYYSVLQWQSRFTLGLNAAKKYQLHECDFMW